MNNPTPKKESINTDYGVLAREHILNIYERVHLVMAECEKLIKKKFIAVGGGGFKVITFDQVMEVVQPLLVKHGILILPSVIAWNHVEPVEIYDKQGRKNPGRTQATVRVRWQNIEDKLDYFEGDWFGFGVDGGDKGPGKATTYAIRNAIMRTLQMMAGEGSSGNQGSNNSSPPSKTSSSKATKPEPTSQTPDPDYKITKNQADDLYDLIQDNDIPREKFNQWMTEYKVGYLEDLTGSQYQDMLHKTTKGKMGKVLYKGS